ncbi:MAG: PilZ domain-containing protein [Myxococcaceae bacterium]|nr:PilZ domain-containing protein [Myxococcaceae bacterium]
MRLEVLRDLITSGRLRGLDKVSVDGVTFKTLPEFPEIAALFQEREAAAASPEAAGEANRLMAEINALKSRPVHDVFGLQQTDSIDAYRAKFFALVRRFYPERIPKDPQPGLREAYSEMFQLLSRLMAQVEALNHAKPLPRPPQLAPPVLTPVAAPVAAPPKFEPKEFIGWERRGDDRVYCDVACTLQNAVQMFTSHKLVNISNGGFFLASSRSPRLGEPMEVSMSFDPPARKIVAMASVVWENQVTDSKTPRGFGCRFTRISDEEKKFIQDFVRRAVAAGAGIG